MSNLKFKGQRNIYASSLFLIILLITTFLLVQNPDKNSAAAPNQVIKPIINQSQSEEAKNTPTVPARIQTQQVVTPPVKIPDRQAAAPLAQLQVVTTAPSVTPTPVRTLTPPPSTEPPS